MQTQMNGNLNAVSTNMIKQGGENNAPQFGMSVNNNNSGADAFTGGGGNSKGAQPKFGLFLGGLETIAAFCAFCCACCTAPLWGGALYKAIKK